MDNVSHYRPRASESNEEALANARQRASALYAKERAENWRLKATNEALTKTISKQEAEILKLKAKHQYEMGLINEQNSSKVINKLKEQHSKEMKELKEQHSKEMKELKRWHSQHIRNILLDHIKESKSTQAALENAHMYPINNAAEHFGHTLAEPFSYDSDKAYKESTLQSTVNMFNRPVDLILKAAGMSPSTPNGRRFLL